MDLDSAVKLNALIVEYLVHGTANELATVQKGIQFHFDLWHRSNPNKVCSPSNNWLAKYLDTERVYLHGTPHERCARPSDLLAEIASSST